VENLDKRIVINEKKIFSRLVNDLQNSGANSLTRGTSLCRDAIVQVG
jgi:hypothetical protein